MRDIDILEYYTPKEGAELLKISPSTLRKYCNLVKKEYGSDYFKRDDTNARLFTKKDIVLLKRIISLRKTPDISLDSAIHIALNEGDFKGIVSTMSQGDTSDSITQTTDIAVLQDYKKLIEKQGAQINQLSAFTKDLIDSNVKLSEQVTKLSNQLEETLIEIESTSSEVDNKKSSFFSRLFNK